MKIIKVDSIADRKTIKMLTQNKKCMDLYPIKTYSQYLKEYGLDSKAGKK